MSMQTKKCGACQETLPVEMFHLDSNTTTGYACYCIACTATKAKESYLRKRDNITYKLKSQLSASKQRAEKKNLQHTLTLQELESLYPKDMICPVFGFTMQWGNPKWSSPSLDRIDSTKGYTLNNCQVISNKANKLKNDATLQELKDLVNYLEDLF